jgi:hypothetical protein
MSTLKIGSFVAVAWNDGSAVGGTSLFIEAELATPAAVPLADLHGIVRVVEGLIRDRWDHRTIDTGVPDLRAFALRVFQVLAPELERRRFPLVAVTLREDPLWSLRLDAAEAAGA